MPRAASVSWLCPHRTEFSPPSFREKQLGLTRASCGASCEQLPKWSRELIRQTAASDSVSLQVSLEEWGGSRPFLWGPLGCSESPESVCTIMGLSIVPGRSGRGKHSFYVPEILAQKWLKIQDRLSLYPGVPHPEPRFTELDILSDTGAARWWWYDVNSSIAEAGGSP